MCSKKRIFGILLFACLVVTFVTVYKTGDDLLELRTRVKNIFDSYYNYTLPRAEEGRFWILDTFPNNTKVQKGLPVFVQPHGGLGNQLFKLACAYSVAKKRKSRLYVETPLPKTFLGSEKHKSTERTYALNHFRIPLVKVEGNKNIKKGIKNIYNFNEKHIWLKSLPPKRVLQLTDFCASEFYFREFREEIKEMLQLDIDETPVRDILEAVNKSNSVAVHVRRGDYLHSYENRAMPIAFQKRAITWMKKLVTDATFFVFSDDIEYAKKEFEGISNMVYVENKKTNMQTLYDFLIMSRCKHLIIANSTFSWWAAYLSNHKGKIVIAPLPRHPPGWNAANYKDALTLKYRDLIQNSYSYPNDWLTFNPWI